ATPRRQRRGTIDGAVDRRRTMGKHAFAAVVVGCTVACLGSTALEAQSLAKASATGSSYEVPRTPWGDPDLQGVWDYRTITPLERRPELGDRAYYTDEEIAELEGRAARRMEAPPDPDAPANLVHAQYMTDPGRFVD